VGSYTFLRVMFQEMITGESYVYILNQHVLPTTFYHMHGKIMPACTYNDVMLISSQKCRSLTFVGRKKETLKFPHTNRERLVFYYSKRKVRDSSRRKINGTKTHNIYRHASKLNDACHIYVFFVSGNYRRREGSGARCLVRSGRQQHEDIPKGSAARR
jgi:hypothetical protein